jgi:hypothetical protein|tara:strand:+ start:144 stop:1124 length:981 start_codon:yes stop_codon:yes gene_type:complete
MAMTPETQKMLMDTLRVSQPQSIAAPLSPFEQIQTQRGLLSTDPVVANLQKLGRGVVGFLSPETPLDYLTMAIPGAKLAKGASGVRRFQWMANKEGGQKIGNMEEIRPITKDVFDKQVKPRIASDMSYQEYITKFPNLKASFISKDGGKSFKFSRIDDEANLTVEPQNPIWRKEVDSFDSPTATKQRMTADSDVISDYMMAHRPYPGPRAHNLLEKVDGDSFSPDDIYQNARFYIGSTPRQKEYKETMEFMDFIKKNKGNPNAEVTIYRGSPNKELNKGDWITPSKEYAKMEAGGKGGQVFAHKVKLKDIRWDGNSLEEWGYFPTK